MAHFAQIDPATSVVLRVVAISNDVTYDEHGVEHEDRGIALCKQLYGAQTEWVQTSYSGSFRGRYAGISFLYDRQADVFVPPLPSSLN